MIVAIEFACNIVVYLSGNCRAWAIRLMIDNISVCQVDPRLFHLNLGWYTMFAFQLEKAFHGDNLPIYKFDGESQIFLFYKNIEVPSCT